MRVTSSIPIEIQNHQHPKYSYQGKPSSSRKDSKNSQSCGRLKAKVDIKEKGEIPKAAESSSFYMLYLKESVVLPSRERSHIPPWAKERHRLKSTFGRRYVSSWEGIIHHFVSCFFFQRQRRLVVETQAIFWRSWARNSDSDL